MLLLVVVQNVVNMGSGLGFLSLNINSERWGERERERERERESVSDRESVRVTHLFCSISGRV